MRHTLTFFPSSFNLYSTTVVIPFPSVVSVLGGNSEFSTSSDQFLLIRMKYKVLVEDRELEKMKESELTAVLEPFLILVLCY